MLPRPITLLLVLPLVCRPQSSTFLIDTIAGSDPTTDNSIALYASLEDVRGVTVDSAGNVYFSDAARHRVYRISTGGLLTTVAGSGKPGFAGDGGPSELALLNLPYGLAADSAGNLYIADLQNARVRRVSTDGVIQTVAGGGSLPVTTPGALAVEVALKAPRNVAVDATGNLYISDFQDQRILRVTTDGRLTVFAGSGAPGTAADSTPALTATLAYPAGLYAAGGTLWVADSGNHVIRRIEGGIMSTVRNSLSSAFIHLPTAVCADPAGNLYVASSGYDEVVRIGTSGTAQVLAHGARDLAADAAGNLYLAAGNFVRKLTPGGQLLAIAGSSGQFRGEATPAVEALLNAPFDVKVAADGSLLVADTANHRIRRIQTSGLITTVAGDGEAGYRGDEGAATAARLSSPKAVATDRAGNLYIADTENHRVRRIGPGGQMVTIAGTGIAGYREEILLALQTPLNAPSALAIDSAGQLHVADTGNHRVLRLLPSGHLVPIVGTGQRGFGGDGGSGLNTLLDSPRGLAFAADGALFIADSGNHRLRKLGLDGRVLTVAGTGQAGFSGDGCAARDAQLNTPTGLSADATGIILSDSGNHRLRRIASDGVIQTIAGTGEAGFNGDRGPAVRARLNDPAGLAVDASGAVYVADRLNQRIRKLTVTAATTVPPTELTTPLRVLHGATLEATPLVPGMVVTLQGQGIGPVTATGGVMGPSGALETTLGDTQVRMDGKPAPILYAQENLINVQVPYRITPSGSVTVEVVRGGQSRGQLVASVASFAPGIFTSAAGSGAATALNSDSTLNSSANAAPRGSVVTFYLTGEGYTDPASLDGRLPEPPYPAPLAPVQVVVGGQTAEVVSLASGQTSPGVLQVTSRLSDKTPAGAQILTVTIGGAASQRNVTLFVK